MKGSQFKVIQNFGKHKINLWQIITMNINRNDRMLSSMILTGFHVIYITERVNMSFSYNDVMVQCLLLKSLIHFFLKRWDNFFKILFENNNKDHWSFLFVYIFHLFTLTFICHCKSITWQLSFFFLFNDPNVLCILNLKENE